VIYLLDTDIASYAIKSTSPKVDRKLAIVPYSQVAVSAITRAELLYGLKKLPPSHPLHATVQLFLRSVRVLPWEPEAGEWYAEIRFQLASSGQPIGQVDMMIAAHALVLGATLVTNNTRHYERIQAPLLLENWAK
jgi:tRNA(fMet)-specific endonuclease VapC